MTITISLLFITIVSIWLSQIFLGTWLTPLSHFHLRWLFLVFLFQLNLLGYDEVSPLTWGVLLGSIFSFSMGAVLPMLSLPQKKGRSKKNDIKKLLNEFIDRKRFIKGIVLLFFLGVGVFGFYIYNINKSFGLVTFLLNGQIARLAHNEGKITPGFHYLYIMELLPPLCFLYFSLYRKSTPNWVFFVMLFSLISLVFSTGRTNISKAFVWSFFVFLYIEIANLRVLYLAKRVLVLVCIGVAFFFIIGTWTRESVKTTAIYSSTDYLGTEQALLMPYFYMSVEIPVFDKLLNDTEVKFQFGKYTLLPISKIIGVFSKDFVVPTHIGEFYPTPFPANIATYLDLMYKDFGFLGPIVLPWLLGFVCSYFFIMLLYGKRITLSLFMINTVLALMVFSSTSAANYMKPSYWFQIIVIILMSKYCQKKQFRRSRLIL